MYQETPANEPCRRLYSDNGFTRDGTAWVLTSQTAEPVDASWLTIVDQWTAAHAAP